MSEMKSLTLNDKKYDGFVDPVARALASASAVIMSASGESITLSDSSENKLFGFNIYGKTTQNGTPTPDAPVEMVSVGESGGITVSITGENESQSVTFVTPNGLAGIPVTSGGNYTDATGKQWVCDEVDLRRGVHIKRIGQWIIDGSEQPFSFTVGNNGGLIIGYYYKDVMSGVLGGRSPKMCDRLQSPPTRTPTLYQDCAIGFWSFNSGPDAAADKFIIFNLGEFSTNDDALSYLQAHPLTFSGILQTPIETPLSAEEIIAYNALRTYRDNTTITNDGVAYMELEYAMDAKKYIDSMIAGPAARLSEVTLLASAWVGANSPYSQVVTIDGITEYSKVDLLPSVEQLAIFHHKDLAFVTENEDGVVTVYAIGDKPANDYTMQVQITEVEV